ncbi:ABC transporter substrate-binding protein [Paenibacillus sp. UNC451MF]|uniref:ABC transporter substrate-binding protein n=1 Tax=Paenibacillus sp. UNC451MF TaxID=1449063 RepID=UPI00049172F5|nr:extracellular solute-binding protein [Paenibacillus sp. UNC451MF]
MLPKNLAGLTVTAFVTMFLAACSTQTATTNTVSDSTGESSQTSISDTSNENVTITIWSGSTGVDAMKKMAGADLLEKKFPNYTFNYISSNGNAPKLPDLFAVNTPIDLYLSSVGGLADVYDQGGFQYDMTDLFKKHNLDLSSLNQVSVQYMKSISKGGMWALPLYTDTLVLYYNKVLFDKFGVAYPKDGMTWEALRELAQKMTRNDGSQYYGLTAEWIPHTFLMNQLSLLLIDPKTNKSMLTSDPKWTEFIQTVYLNNMSGPEMKDNVNNKSSLPNRTDFVKSQNVAMMTGLASYTNQIPELQQNMVDWDVVSLPTFKENPSVGPQEYPVYIGMTSISQHKDAVMNVLKYMESKEYQDNVPLYAGGIPALDASKGSFITSSKSKGKNLNAVFYNKPATTSPKTIYDSISVNALNKVIPQIVAGNMDLNTALRSVDEEVDKKIMELKR